MNALTRSITHALKGAAHAFQAFPAAILNALAFVIVTIIRIQLDWPAQEPYNFLFNCLHWSFAFGAIFSLAAITASLRIFGEKRAFALANVLGLAAAAAAFLLLYYFGAADPEIVASRYTILSTLAVARISAAILIAFLSFIVLAADSSRGESDISSALFMTQKAFFIALIYGIVIMAGISGVAGAVQALLYSGLSSKIYMYIGTAAGFLAFTIFVGYFPDFNKNQVDYHREVAEKQPRFIEVLFGYIMVPIILALTAVLLIWAGKTLFDGMGSSFVRLASIAASFTIAGIWLHMMVAHHKSTLTEFYRKVYPFAALIILVFEAWALYLQLQASGMKTTEYTFIILWVLTAAAALLLLSGKKQAYLAIFALTGILALVWVLPIVGAHALPVTAQVDRLEQLLTEEEMLKEGQMVPAASMPEREVRESITDAVLFLAYSESAKLPGWFDRDLRQGDVFRTKTGFEQTWPEFEDNGNTGEFMSLSLSLPTEAVNIGDYKWAVALRDYYNNKNGYIAFAGENGTYRIYWLDTSRQGIPTLKITLDNRTIIEQDLNNFIDRITEKYPPGKTGGYNPSVADMSLHLETPEMEALLVLKYVNINVDPQSDIIQYWIDPDALYLNEKQ